ncbi:universal stress protein [Chitinophagaceae bacterium LB-8]|uniref:Universal stress protein n=1 Tax=Paraflavisolibacter caeni TaxID=2982496 RepID=A0A9X2XV63_9BACT|nr:universal stress protein [Paraflavisolibacter caeni]MCU7549295.1 universal stress protein [Paraflavisolibacter caeni]
MNTHQFNKILIPIDLSESSLNAFETALYLAECQKASVEIIYVQDNTFSSNNPNSLFNDRLFNNYEDIFNALADTANKKLGNKPKIIIEEGLASAAIVHTAIKNNCDLIVMGVHGASGFREQFIGTNAYNVVKYAECPVLTIPTKKKCKEFKNVLFPIKPLYGTFKNIDQVLALTSEMNTNLQMLCLSSYKNEDEQLFSILIEELKSKLVGERINISTQFSSGNNFADHILTCADQLGVDLILLTSSIDITYKQQFIGPHTQRIIHQAKVPVLIMKRSS